ncbi:DUF2169 domain-containing protein [Afifella sp. H1R]|uniref:DUF2169 family type VI secretion system accessory protein n=1 Tax=Afifella sp. H1R TaxID=2908841 RepID=UPI001F21B85B|nr:DUF2169 domain-containing protein [Afifella sp. H1R]MCF1505973.1 DUF2169 domain-containing protein [Afifella sp. H1R]
MWSVDHQTPFESQGYFVRDRDGAEHWVVGVRAIFDIREDGFVSVAEAQKPVRLAPEYDDDEAAELAAETDLCPFRRRADFIVKGVACLPDAAEATAFEASVAVAGFEKRAFVCGKRQLHVARRRAVIEGPEPFGGVRLTWRNSLGGRDPLAETHEGEDAVNLANPVGKGWTAQWAKLPDATELDLPSIENASERIDVGRPLPAPFGFGPVQPYWQPRRDHAGTYDEAWRATRSPLLPEDFDERFHQAAPDDQVLGLKGGERIRAINLHPDGLFEFRLPQLILEARTRLGRETIDHRFRLISVCLDTEAKRVEMVWNAHVPCNGRDMELDGSTVRLRQMSGVAR